ncbi:MAG TPA: hypothetical protein VN039_10440, partial [Nitrospira sp.]|nr:hypothetical protein [Nitrospira sp.]
DRLRHSSRFLEWLTTQAARLGSTAFALWSLLQSGFTSDQIEGATPLTNTTPPVITGTPKVGVVLTSDNGAWSVATGLTYAYQWDAGGAPVGTNQNTYTPVAGDVGKTVTCTVTATAGASSASSTSAATAAVAA